MWSGLDLVQKSGNSKWFARQILTPVYWALKWRGNGNGRIQKIPTQNHQKKQLHVFGYINRTDGLEKQKLSGSIRGTKSRGRQRTNTQTFWMTTLREKNPQEWAHRESWRQRRLEGHDCRCLQQTWHFMMMMVIMSTMMIMVMMILSPFHH